MKHPVKSKLNILGAVIVILGLVMDPEFQAYLGEFLPPELMARIVSGSGILVMILRSFFTSEAVRIKGREGES